METLYRKYRSQTFSELVGQTQVTQILRNAIRRERLSHAYLFCGPRGTGKTSVARIFAKALCCLDPRDGDCCGVCANCTSIASGAALDVQEIDAASKNKVDDIRELRDRVGYAPAQFRYKIYIIDEVHMVTSQGFNALLKTLEEPPAHVKFLLCTTEAHKLPVTILSRCIRLDFTRIALPELAAHLQWIAGQEGFVLDNDAALELAALAEGSARDAISLLDQLTVYCEGTISRHDVRELFQLGDPELVPSVVKAIAADAKRELLDTWERLAGQGADAGRFLLQVADALKQCYLETTDPAWRRALEAIWQGLNLLKQESFPALLVELALLQAADAFAASPAAVASGPDYRHEVSAGRSPGQAPQGALRKPDFLRKAREEPTPASPATDFPPPRSAPIELPAVADTPHPPQVAALEPQAADDVNPALADQHFVAYLAALKPLSLPAYALASQYAQPGFADGVLALGFNPAQRWARQACAYAQFPELLDALAAAAQAAYGTDRLRVGMTGEEAGWKKHGFPFELGHSPPREPVDQQAGAGQPSAPHALFRGRSKPQPLDMDELQEREAPDLAQVIGEAPLGPPKRIEVEAGLEQLGQQLDRAAQSSVSEPATIDDVLELFGGRIIED